MKPRKFSYVDVATVAVLVAAIVVVSRPDSALRAPVEGRISDFRMRLRIDDAWNMQVQTSTPLYAGEASAQVIEFSDYECPFCRALNPSVDSALLAGIKVAYLHYPIASHPNAKRAALLAICARQFNKFGEVHDYLMTSSAWQQDSNWSALPELAGLYADSRFELCLTDQATVATLERHKSLGDGLRIQGTPTLVSQSAFFSRVVSAHDIQGMARQRR